MSSVENAGEALGYALLLMSKKSKENTFIQIFFKQKTSFKSVTKGVKKREQRKNVSS